MSIRRQLLLLIIATVTLASFFSALHGYRNSTNQLELVFDQELSSVSQFILAIAESNKQFPDEIKSEFAYKIYKDKVLISSSTHMMNYNEANDVVGFSEESFFGKRWRTLSIDKTPFNIVVAHPIEKRIASAESILLATIVPIIVAIPLIAFIIFYIIQKSLKPLTSLSNQIKEKSTDDLSTLYIEQETHELTPVIERLNNLFGRLSDSFDREKQLTANAAHELRTPISVLTVNTHNLLEDYKNHSLSENAIVELEMNVQRMAHVIEQVIALYRFTPEDFNDKKEHVKVEPLLQDVISQNYQSITDKDQNIMLESENVTVSGNYFALFTLFENLVRNAIKYGGDKASININMKTIDDALIICVEDSGIGVEDIELARIFNRFYRAENNSVRVKSSGLGLSIVEHIATLHNATVSATRSELGGLCVAVKFSQFSSCIGLADNKRV